MHVGRCTARVRNKISTIQKKLQALCIKHKTWWLIEHACSKNRCCHTLNTAQVRLEFARRRVN